MGSQLRVKKSGQLPAVITNFNGSQTTHNAGIEGLAFEQYVDESGNTWVRLAGTGSMGGVGPSGNTVPFKVDGLGVLSVSNGTGAPSGTRITGTGTMTGAAAALSATLAAATGKTTYISGFAVTGMGATAGAGVLVTVTGLITGTQNFYAAVPTGATVPMHPLVVTFHDGIPASAIFTAIVVDVPSFGLGNLQAAVSAWGYQL